MHCSFRSGDFPFNGEEVRLALGLPSACFELNRHGSDVRFSVRGRGHGWGLSQTEAQALAEDGWSAEAILEYFIQAFHFLLNKSPKSGKNTTEVIKR